jgi:hypothetical protein
MNVGEAHYESLHHIKTRIFTSRSISCFKVL